MIVDALAAAGVYDMVLPLGEGGVAAPVDDSGPRRTVESFMLMADPNDAAGPQIPALNDAGQAITRIQATALHASWSSVWSRLNGNFLAADRHHRTLVRQAVGVMASHLGPVARRLVQVPFHGGDARAMWAELNTVGMPAGTQSLQLAMRELSSLKWREGGLAALQVQIQTAIAAVQHFPGQGVETPEAKIERIKRLVFEAHPTVFGPTIALLEAGTENDGLFDEAKHWRLLRDAESRAGDVWALPKRSQPIQPRRIEASAAAFEDPDDDTPEPPVNWAQVAGSRETERRTIACQLCKGNHFTRECTHKNTVVCECGWHHHKNAPCTNRKHDRSGASEASGKAKSQASEASNRLAFLERENARLRAQNAELNALASFTEDG